MSVIEGLRRTVFHSIPPYSRILYQFCSRYVDRFNGDNNSNPETNGEYSYLRKIIGALKDGVVFDVGANVGDWASFALNLNPKVQLHCFEPSTATFRRLSQRQWPSNVHLNNFGLGEAEAAIALNVIAEGSGINSVYIRRGFESARSGKTEEIRICTIDEYCERKTVGKIDLIKVDVEGHELPVFKGMRRMLGRGVVSIIQFEYGGCNLDAKMTLGDIWDFLEPHGFRFHKLFPEGPRLVDKYQRSLETFKYSNWIASR